MLLNLRAYCLVCLLCYRWVTSAGYCLTSVLSSDGLSGDFRRCCYWFNDSVRREWAVFVMDALFGSRHDSQTGIALLIPTHQYRSGRYDPTPTHRNRHECKRQISEPITVPITQKSTPEIPESRTQQIKKRRKNNHHHKGNNNQVILTITLIMIRRRRRMDRIDWEPMLQDAVPCCWGQ